MSMKDDLTKLGDTSPTKHRGKRYPDGWQPRSEVEDGVGGFIVSEPYTDTVDPDGLFELHGLNPGEWTITRSRSSRWQMWRSGEDEPVWLKASQIHFEPAASVRVAMADADKIVTQISKWRPRTPKQTTGRSLWCPVGDTQIGKIEGGGTAATIDRFLTETDSMVATQREVKAEQVVLPWLGDCIEGVVSQKGKVQGRIDLTVTEQVRVIRRLLMAQLKAHAPYTDKIVVPAIPGNHDEPSRELFTVGTDSWALDAVSAVADGVAENPELCDKITFLYPDPDTMTVTLDDQDVRVSMAHGHQFPTSKGGWERWWDGQIRSRLLPGDADILLAAHRHHLEVKDFGGGRVFIQIPALDGGSQHFDDRVGGNTPSRMVSFVLDDGRIRRFDPIL